MGDYQVSVTPNMFLNSTRGIISEVDLLNVPEQDIVEGLCGQGVVAASRKTLRVTGTGNLHNT